MKPWVRAGRLLGSCVVTVLIVVLAPAVLLAGEMVNRYYLGSLPSRPAWAPRRRRYRPAGGQGKQWRRVARSERSHSIRAEAACRHQSGRMVHVVIDNPLWIALTAPARWLFDRIRPPAGSRRGRDGNGPPGAGVREPRRPLPDLPAGAMALPEPRSFP